MSQQQKQHEINQVLAGVFGFFSVLGSFFIIVDFFRDPQKRKATYSRLLFVLSSLDCITSIAYMFSSATCPFPTTTTPGILESSTQQTSAGDGGDVGCVVQGFVIQAGLATPFYNLSLAIYYLLVIGYGWKQRRINQMEPYLHAVPLVIGFGTSIAALLLDLFHGAVLWCWIAPNHEGNNNYNLYRWLLFYGPLWFCIVAVTVIMCALHRSVKKVETKTLEYAAKGSRQKNSLARQVFWQAFWFVGVFYLTWMFSTISRIVEAIMGFIPYPLEVLQSISVPAQGLGNFFIYFRPRYLRYRKRKQQQQQIHPKKLCCHFLLKAPLLKLLLLRITRREGVQQQKQMPSDQAECNDDETANANANQAIPPQDNNVTSEEHLNQNEILDDEGIVEDDPAIAFMLTNENNSRSAENVELTP